MYENIFDGKDLLYDAGPFHGMDCGLDTASDFRRQLCLVLFCATGMAVHIGYVGCRARCNVVVFHVSLLDVAYTVPNLVLVCLLPGTFGQVQENLPEFSLNTIWNFIVIWQNINWNVTFYTKMQGGIDVGVVDINVPADYGAA